MDKKITIEDLDEIAVWRKRDAFMKIFFDIHNDSTIKTIVHSIRDSYLKAELIWVIEYGGRAYESVESFQRTYYYYLNEKYPKPIIPTKQLSLF